MRIMKELIYNVLPGFETERAFKALEVVSKTATMTEQMVRNAAGAYKKGK